MRPMTEYVVIIPYGWMNLNGHSIRYTAGPHADTFETAITTGFNRYGTDDFNIGVIKNGKLTDFLYMHESLHEPPEILQHINREIGLES